MQMVLLQGQALASLGLHDDLMLLVFTMVDRDDEDSALAPFWRSVPVELVTGMSTAHVSWIHLLTLPCTVNRG